MKNLLENSGINGLVQTRQGWLVYNKNDKYVGASIQKYGEFSEGEMEVFSQLIRDGDYVVEVGANIGSHTVALSKKIGASGKIFAYEPQRIVFQTLCANISINSCLNVHCFEQAVSDEKSLITIPDLDYSKQGNFGGISIENFSKGREVDVIILDEKLKDIPRLNFIKIDVEGMESKVLKGAMKLIKKFKPILYVENDRLEKSKELIELIQSMGYRLYWHAPKLYNPNNYAGDKENIFGNIASWNMLCFHKSINTNISGLAEVLDSESHPLKN